MWTIRMWVCIKWLDEPWAQGNLHSLSMGEKKTSEVGLVLFHLYRGAGFPELDRHVSVTFPFSTGFSDTEHIGTEGGTRGGTGCFTWCRNSEFDTQLFSYLSHPDQTPEEKQKQKQWPDTGSVLSPCPACCLCTETRPVKACWQQNQYGPWTGKSLFGSFLVRSW